MHKADLMRRLVCGEPLPKGIYAHAINEEEVVFTTAAEAPDRFKYVCETCEHNRFPNGDVLHAKCMAPGEPVDGVEARLTFCPPETSPHWRSISA